MSILEGIDAQIDRFVRSNPHFQLACDEVRRRYVMRH